MFRDLLTRHERLSHSSPSGNHDTENGDHPTPAPSAPDHVLDGLNILASAVADRTVTTPTRGPPRGPFQHPLSASQGTFSSGRRQPRIRRLSPAILYNQRIPPALPKRLFSVKLCPDTLRPTHTTVTTSRLSLTAFRFPATLTRLHISPCQYFLPGTSIRLPITIIQLSEQAQRTQQ